MSKYNIYIVRAMSKKQRKAYLAIAAKYSYKKYLKLNFTFTNNNIFVNLCNGLGESLFKKTFGLIKSKTLNSDAGRYLMLRLLTVPIRGHRYVISFCPRLTVKLYMSSTLHDDRAMS